MGQRPGELFVTVTAFSVATFGVFRFLPGCFRPRASVLLDFVLYVVDLVYVLFVFLDSCMLLLTVVLAIQDPHYNSLTISNQPCLEDGELFILSALRLISAFEANGQRSTPACQRAPLGPPLAPPCQGLPGVVQG